MSSKAGSTFVTFLMSIPVAAAGLMAIFGVPPLSSVIAASRNLNEKFQELGSDSRSSRSGESSEFEEWDEGSAPAWDDQQTSSERGMKGTPATRSGGSRRQVERDDLGFSRTEDESGFDDQAVEDLAENSEDISSNDGLIDVPSHHPNDNKSLSRDERVGRSPPSMKESLKKLHLISGMKHYHLEPGAEEDTWLFVCLFSASGESNVVYRFEAEAPDPETAVTRTLDQIESWQLERFRDKQAISQYSSPGGMKSARSGSQSEEF